MAKEKSITELRDEKRQLAAQAQGIIDGARNEQRQFNDSENSELGKIQVRMAEINLEIASHEEENRGKGTPHAKGERFSLRRAILASMNRTEQRDAEAAVIEEGARLHRSVASETCGELIIPLESRAAFYGGTEGEKGVVVDTDQMEMLLPLQTNLVLSKAGARIMTGLVGNITWPKYTGSTVAWEDEVSNAPDGAGEFQKGTVHSPKRLTAYVDISKQLLIQENMSVEGLIRQTLAQAIAQKVEATAFGKHEHANNTPDGMFLSFSEASVDLTWAEIVKMETKADVANALFGNIAYIMHPTLIGKAKTKVKDASGAGGFIIGENGMGYINGYRAFRTTNMPTEVGSESDGSGIVFGNWFDYFVGQWGAIDMTVDPYTQANRGLVRIVVNSYWDMGKIRDESFSIAAMK